MERPLLMIPGPVEVSPAVLRASQAPPPGHMTAAFVTDFSRALRAMRQVWRAGPDDQPFVLAGSGTSAMDFAVCNTLAPGDRFVVVETGYFSLRLAEMGRRRGAEVTVVPAPPGEAPPIELVAETVARVRPKVLGVTHVDTSTGVRTDARALAAVAQQHGALSLFDGVCSTGGEAVDQAAWGADVVLTASQKALGLPVGLALLVMSPAALAARTAMTALPPLSLDAASFLPVMTGYEAEKPTYFATPATTLVTALRVGLDEIVDYGVQERWAAHARAANAIRQALTAMQLTFVPSPGLAANTLSAVWYPPGVGPALIGSVRERGAVIAGGLHPAIKDRYFRVGHMGFVTTEPDLLLRTVVAIAQGLADQGYGVDPDAAVQAAAEALA